MLQTEEEALNFPYLIPLPYISRYWKPIAETSQLVGQFGVQADLSAHYTDQPPILEILDHGGVG